LKTILVVDDDPNIRLLLRDDLWERGYNVITAVDGEEAIISFTEEYVDLVVLDIRMPKLNGVEVLNMIRTANTDVPVILYTANPDDISNGSLLKNTSKIVKSSDLTELLDRIEETLHA